jgi:hypothetical protein
VVVACQACGRHWPDGTEALCAEADHQHQRFEVHRHRSPVILADGAELMAVSFDTAEPYRREPPPEFGLYLDQRWSPPWPHAHVDWPDFGLPTDPSAAVGALRSLHHRAADGERVELGCLGGHGRTGTALAVLAVISGVDPAGAVAWTRDHYCTKAVETAAQEQFVAEWRPDGRPRPFP